ncbi:uncharacterized protein LOC125064368 [Vanessa atalanta]|uniref:uncharacterized protein LOC125064368 n=1 Tax=Vanessa atalanta TaxID=42275 RepID=UPI001FCCF619|nr:uncharacterized protein LOC125064368 [Vanessa atalanta]
MSRYLRPETFNVEPDTASADLRWLHWRYTFINFISEEACNETDEMKLKLLINHLSPTVYSYIRDNKSYEHALSLLDHIYLKPKNEIFARYTLVARKQRQDETITEYVRALKLLAHDCNFKAVTPEEYKSEYIRDAFVAGITSQTIRQRLLENNTLSLDEALNQAIALETAERNSQGYINNNSFNLNALSKQEQETPTQQNLAVANYSRKKHCFFCGGNIHRRFKCPARNATCQLCTKTGHFANVCRSNKETLNNVVNEDAPVEVAMISAASPSSLKRATVSVTINNYEADALIDTGSSVSFVSGSLAQTINLKRNPCKQAITLASLNHISFVEGSCVATIKIGQHIYKRQPLLIVNNLCADLIIGHDLLQNHSVLEFQFGGNQGPLKVCSVIEASVPPATLFSNLSPNIRPISIKSKRYSEEDLQFINNEISKLLEEGVIEPSVSPWRAQVLVTGGGLHRKRLVIDYSLTINRFTELDAFPLPSIESVIEKVAKFNFFSQIDLKSAYHQVPILSSERKYTAFEACGKLYPFSRIPFGVTNGVAAFQRTLQYIIDTEKLAGTFAYLDDVTVCGYSIYNNTIKPDNDRLKPLLDLPIPTDLPTLKRTLGLFAHYSKWIQNFSQKIRPLIGIKHFPLNQEAVTCFNSLKSDVCKSTLVVVDENATFMVETDASEFAIASTLSQNGRPVAFFSRTLTDSECKQSSIEKEASAIVESLRKWRHYLTGRHFLLLTDQQSVVFMFNQKHSSKIKNEKIERWRLELSSFKFEIIYRPGKDNTVADTLSRVCAHINFDNSKLKEIHELLCHPGVTRLAHWVRTKNLPYSINDIKLITTSCRVCAEIKPRFNKNKYQLIKATSPFERLNIDFKGPLPSNTQNKYMLTIIDEYSRFPFAYPCKDMTATTVIKCLKDLFFMFGTPLYVHSDRGATFMSEQLKQFLYSLGIACSRTTPYNPQGNGQVERLNGTLWRNIQLYLRSKDMEISDWEKALPVALHSIRSLLCTSTNVTPHERMFNHARRTSNGESFPSWMLNPGPVLMKKNVRATKYDPIVEEVELLQPNPQYSYVRLPDGRETTISNRQLAPLPENLEDCNEEHEIQNSENIQDENPIPNQESDEYNQPPELPSTSSSFKERRSTRQRRMPNYLNDYVVS